MEEYKKQNFIEDSKQKKEEVINMNRITDLLSEALQHDDYKFRINSLVAGLTTKESNDTSEKEAKTREWLGEIREFCENYTGEHKEYFEHILGAVTKFLEYECDV